MGLCGFLWKFGGVRIYPERSVNCNSIQKEPNPGPFGDFFKRRLHNSDDNAVPMKPMNKFNHWNPIWLSGVPQGSILVYFRLYVIAEKSFCDAL